MPTENAPTLDLSTGAFYMTPLDGGDPVRLGRAVEVTQTVEHFDEYNELGVRNPVPARPASLSFEVTLQGVTFDPVTLWRLTHDIRFVGLWAAKYRPKLLHLVTYAKTYRKRSKNARRILREFFEEVDRHGKT